MPPALEAGERTLYRAGLLRAIDWALAPAEEDRPQTAGELRDALGRLEADPASEVATFLAGGLPFPEPASAAPQASGSPASGQPPSAPASAPSSSGPSTTGVFDGDTLKRLTTGLVSHLGPIAGVLVKAAAKRCQTLPQLVEALGAEIGEPAARAAFLKAFAEVMSGPASGRSSTPRSAPASQPASAPASAGAPGAGLDPVFLARAEAELAKHLGAVAKAVVRRAADRAESEADLVRRLAEELEDAPSRQAFLGRMKG
jgi:serine/threonine-protein kinase